MKERIMAENDNTDAAGAGNGDDQITAAMSVYEGRLLLESARMAIETLQGRGKTVTSEELSVIQKLLQQAGDAFETAQQAMLRLFGLEIGHA
jgi:hypothetical protein